MTGWINWLKSDTVLLHKGRTNIGVTTPGYLAGWGYPTWQDEFDYLNGSGQHAIDPSKWNIRDRSTFGLVNDASVIDANQVSATSSNTLRVAADWLSTPVVTSTGPAGNPTNRWHKTGYLDHRAAVGTSEIYSQQYGVWEFRVKMPMALDASMGTLGAVWLRNGNTGECDMCEGWGSGPASMPAVTNLHPAGRKPNNGTTTTTVHGNTSGGGSKVAWTLTPAMYDEWRTYRFTWTPSLFRMEVDDVTKINEVPGGANNHLWTEAGFQSPWHVRINLHIGPSTQYYGLPDPAHHEWTPDSQVLEVDYIRMYRYTP